MKKIAFIFHSSPHAISAGREGLDALLATSAYHDNLAVFFVAEGVLQLVKNQQPEHVLSRDYLSAFKLLDLYDIEQRYVCQQSLTEWGMDIEDLLIEAQSLTPVEIAKLWQDFDHVLTF
ncbi:sulfurtransferase complex subunit TusC [Vibrio sp.]|uniref:sulfurtransferase complex subunit TusC n=1 Tax=Vibrio sp. TaxID=678 RepID=UPI003D12769B